MTPKRSLSSFIVPVADEPLPPTPSSLNSPPLSVTAAALELSESDKLQSASEKSPECAKQYLIVDDNNINLKVMSAYMKKLGLDYRTAMNGKEALDAFTQDPCSWSCILMDISMPIMDGFEATRRIRAYERQEGLAPRPIVALSGLSSDDAHQEAFDSGMDTFLTKPVKLAAFKELLDSLPSP